MTRQTADSDLTKSIKDWIDDYLSIHFQEKDAHKFFQKCSFLDPKYKTRFSPDAEALLRTEAKGLLPVTGKMPNIS